MQSIGHAQITRCSTTFNNWSTHTLFTAPQINLSVEQNADAANGITLYLVEFWEKRRRYGLLTNDLRYRALPSHHSRCCDLLKRNSQHQNYDMACYSISIHGVAQV